MFLRFLSSRQNGSDPYSIVKAECTRRAYCHELSQLYDVEKVHTGGINTLDIDLAESRYLLTGTADASIAIHDLHNLSGEPKYTFPCVAQIPRQHRHAHKFSIETVQWYPLDTGMFISSGTDQLLKVWDANYLQAADEFEFSGLVCSHHISPIATQHSLIAVGARSSKVRLLDLKSGAATHTLRGHRHPVITVRWSSKDEYLLASGGEDSKIHMWDVRSAKGPMMVLDQHNGRPIAKNSISKKNTAHDGTVNGLCFTPDGLQLVSFGSDCRIRVWNTSTGSNTLVNFGKVQNDCKKSVKFTISENTSPSLLYIPSGSNIQVFNLSCGDPVATLSGHFNPVSCVLFDGQDQTLYSGGNDRNLLIWTPLTEAVLAYQHHLDYDGREQGQEIVASTNHLATADAWSSDED